MDGRPDTSERDGNSAIWPSVIKIRWTADRILQNGMETRLTTCFVNHLPTADRILQNGMETSRTPPILKSSLGRQTGYFRTGWKHKQMSLYHHTIRTADRILQNGMETSYLAKFLDIFCVDGRPDTSERDGNVNQDKSQQPVKEDGRPDTSERDGIKRGKAILALET